MYCPRCAASNPDSAVWCNQCGSPIRPSPTPAPAPTPPPAAPSTAQSTAAQATTAQAVFVNSGAASASPMVVNIKSHTGLAVFSLLCGLCCCCPGMIAAIVAVSSAMSVNNHIAAHNIAGAQAASSRAALWAWIAILCGILGLITQFILGIIYGGALLQQANQI